MTETTTKPGSEDAGESTQSHATAPNPDTKPDNPRNRVTLLALASVVEAAQAAADAVRAGEPTTNAMATNAGSALIALGAYNERTWLERRGSCVGGATEGASDE